MSIQLVVLERGLRSLQASLFSLAAMPQPRRAQSAPFLHGDLPQAAPLAACNALFSAPVATWPEPLSPQLGPLARQVMSNMPVVRDVQDYRRMAGQTFARARQGQRPGIANVVQHSEGHYNMAGVNLFEHLLRTARQPENRSLKINTVLFEFKKGQEWDYFRRMRQVEADIAGTPGGAVEYFRNIASPAKLHADRSVYMLSLSLRLGFKVEFMDLDTDLANHEARNYTMNQHIRRATAHGEGVILVNGAMHVGPMQTMLLNGQEVRSGPAVHPPVNMVSISMIDDLYPGATNELLEQYLAHRLPAGRSQLVRAPRGTERNYLPSGGGAPAWSAA